MSEMQDCYFNAHEAALYLGRSTRWIHYKLRSLSPPPSYKCGKARLFRKSELDRWLEQFREVAAPEDIDLAKLVDQTLAELSGNRK